MNCYKHIETIAVSQCKGCGRGMCPECTNQFSVPSCEHCMTNETKAHQKEKRAIKKRTVSSILFEISLTIIIGVLGHIFFNDPSYSLPDDGPILSFLTKYLMFFISAGFVAGYYTINAIKPKQKPNTIKVTVRRLDDSSGLIRSVIKFFVAGFIGVYILPFRTVYNVYRIIK